MCWFSLLVLNVQMVQITITLQLKRDFIIFSFHVKQLYDLNLFIPPQSLRNKNALKSPVSGEKKRLLWTIVIPIRNGT